MAQATLRDRVLERTATTGTGALTLLGVPDARFRTFLAAMGGAAVTYYCIVHEELNEWEIGIGTVNGDGTFTRSTVLKSTNANALVSFSAGSKRIFHDVPAEKMLALDTDSTKLTLPGQVSAVGLATLSAGFAAGASSTLSAGSDADSDFRIGSGSAVPTASRLASLTLDAPDSGGFRGMAKVLLKRAAALVWGVGLFSSVAGAMGAVTDYAWDPGTGTPVAALSAAGALKLSSNLDVGGTFRVGGITYTWPASQAANRYLKTDGAGNLTWASILETLALTDLSDVAIAGQATGQILRASGASTWANSTATFPNTVAAGALLHGSATNVWSELAIGSNANVVLGQSGGLPAWLANVTLSSGTDANTTLTLGTGGGAPTGNRTVALVLNTPHAANVGAASIYLNRASVTAWHFGVKASGDGPMTGTGDHYWSANTTTVMALTTAGQLRAAAGFWSGADIVFSADNANNIGSVASARPARIYVGSAIYIGPTSALTESPLMPSGSSTGDFWGITVDNQATQTVAQTTRIRLRAGATPGAGGGADIGAYVENATGGTRQTGLAFWTDHQAAGGLTQKWRVTASGHFIAGADNVYDIGALAATRPRTGYFGTSVVVGIDPGGSDALRAGGNAFINAGTDVSTVLTVGGGGASPTGTRQIVIDLNAPSSGGFPGRTQLRFYRAAALMGIAGFDESTTGAKQAITDWAFTDSSGANRMALTQAGQLRTTGGFWTNSSNGLQLTDGTITGYAAVISGAVRFGSSSNHSTVLIQNGTDRWTINTSGYLLANADNSYDIGAAGANRPRSLFIGASLAVGTTATIGSTTILGTDPGGSALLRVGGNSTISAGTDTNTTLTFGTGGGAPTAQRTVGVYLNSPHSGGQVGATLFYLQRASTDVWQFGVPGGTAGVLSGNTDFGWYAGAAWVASIAPSGQFRSASGFWSNGGNLEMTNGNALFRLGTTVATQTNAANFITNNITATSSAAFGTYFSQTLTSAASNDILRSVRIDPTFSVNAAHTGVQVVGLRINGFTVAGLTSPLQPTGIEIGSITGTGATNAASLDLGNGPTGASNNYLILAANFKVFSNGTTVIAGDPGGSDKLRVLGNATISFGSDGNTTVTVGTGGGSPTAARTATLALNAPHSGTFVGAAYVNYYRDSGAAIWQAGIESAATGAKTTNTDMAWYGGGAFLMALSASSTDPRLKVAGSASAALYLADLGATSGTRVFGVMSDANVMKFGVVSDDYTSSFTIKMTLGLGLQIGAPTGGDKGNGTINVAGDIYKNDSAYANPDYVFEYLFTGKIVRFADKPGAAEFEWRTLPQMEEYARTHLRLPGISDDPMGLFARGDILLQHIESAYAYLFDHERRIASLEAKLAGASA